MDDRRFDALVRSLATGTSRRGVLRSLIGLAGGAAFASSLSDTDAARRPTPTPKPPSCPGQQTFVNGACVCQTPKAPGPEKCGPDCCNPAGAGAAYSECCDNACCFGTCYGEERCCPYPRAYCPSTGECCPDGWTCCPEVGCLPPGQCCTAADCPAESCESAICTADRQCAYAFDCSAGEGCCPTDVCTERACIEGACAEPDFDCRNNDGGAVDCCEEGLTCQPDGSCACVPTCNGTCGGPDGCGGTCGCAPGYNCNGEGECYLCGTCNSPFAACGPGGACRSHCDVNGNLVCVGARPCDSPSCSANSDCPAGEVCFQAGCCGGVKFCVPLCA